MKTKLLAVILLILHYHVGQAQSFAINTDGSTANPSALLDVKSTAKGVLIPRMTKTQRNSIISPATSLLLFQTGPDSIGYHYYNGSSWSWISSTSNGSDWKLTGNAGTDTAINFIGTLDNMPIRFKINNLKAGEISTINTSYGYKALMNNTSGQLNVAIGRDALMLNTTGIENTAIGQFPLWKNTGGNNNIAIGYQVLFNNQTGSNNIAIGRGALIDNFTNSYNTGIGYYALSYSKSNHNTAIGSFSLYNNSSGDNNVSVGDYSLYNNSIGSFITGLGDSADVLNINLNNATAIGARSAVGCSNCMVLGSINGINGATSNVNVGIGTTTPDALLHVQRGAVLFDSTIGGTPVSGPGTRMMWIPAKASFRAGYVTGTQWDDINIGDYSFALGYNTKAGGDFSTAMGINTLASGIASTTMGTNTSASGAFSTAMGQNTSASGVNSTAMGAFTSASGYNSTAMGDFTSASGFTSTAMGTLTIASGTLSTSIGYGTNSKSFGGIVLGTYNDSTNTVNASNFNPLNRLFQIGNGTAINARSNAMTVLQNGNIGIGELNPAYPLNFESTLGDKISLWGNGANHYGLGIQPSLLQVYSDAFFSDIAFGYGNSGAFTERMRIKGSGNVGIGTSAPSALLDVNGTTTTNALQVSNGTVITKMQTGSITVGPSASSLLTYTITFPVAFASAAPRVFATARNEPATNYNDAFSVSVRSVSATAVTLNIQRTDFNGLWAQQLRVDWFAVE